MKKLNELLREYEVEKVSCGSFVAYDVFVSDKITVSFNLNPKTNNVSWVGLSDDDDKILSCRMYGNGIDNLRLALEYR